MTVVLQSSVYIWWNNVHTWTSVFLRHLTSMSFMVPVLAIHWARLCPHSGNRAFRSHACPEDAVYSLRDRSSNFTQRLFASWVASPHVPYKLTLHYTYNTHKCTYYIHDAQHIFFIQHIHACHLNYLYLAGWLLSALNVRYTYSYNIITFLTNIFCITSLEGNCHWASWKLIPDSVGLRSTGNVQSVEGGVWRQ